METISVNQPINLKVVRFELDFSKLLPEEPIREKKSKKIRVPKPKSRKRSIVPPPPAINCSQKRDVKELVEELLEELYSDQRDWSCHSTVDCSRGSTSAASLTSLQSNYVETEAIERNYLECLEIEELREQTAECQMRFQYFGDRLARCVKTRDRLRRKQKRFCAALTILLRHITGESGARFSVTPGGSGDGPGEGGYAEWLHAMRLVARLPAGVPQHFRKKLWLTLAERNLTARGVDWLVAERACFRGTAQPDDTELGAQILKDLHRTGCSLFCGAEGRENQAMLRRVLLAYARWNKEVGYCQGFNMLAAIILEVMDKSESDSLKVMIYLVEAVLPEGYFADDLRGLSADMAAFRDLLRLRLPRLAHHMDHLQRISDGGGIEPPLPDVFTMQWFLTLYATWLPRESLLRIWDLILLDGNEVLLLTALAIWDMLQDRILSARSADEFYSCMGGGAGAVWEAGDSLVARVVAFGSAPELPRLRSLHRYRVAPPAPPTTAPIYYPPIQSAMQSMTKRGLRLFYSEDEGDSSDDGNKMALATVMPRKEERIGAGDRLTLDIGALKRQYARLRERQRQAHVILAAACARHAAVGVPTSPTSLTVNNLLLGKSAIVSSRGRRLGAPPGAIPPLRQSKIVEKSPEVGPRARSNETISWNEEKSRKSLSRRNSVKWKDIRKDKSFERKRKTSIDLDEIGDGVIVSEIEANQMIASIRSRSSSETSTYSSNTSSTDTSLCDENERGSDSEPDISDDGKEKRKESSGIKGTHLHKGYPMVLKETKIAPCNPLKEESGFNNDNNKLYNCSEQSIKSITEYLDSAAGKPLRTYIGGFETKLKDNMNIDNECDDSLKRNVLPQSSSLVSDKSDILQRNCSMNSSDLMPPTNIPKTANNFTDLSPIDLSPYNYNKSPFDYDFASNFIRPVNTEASPSIRPPDIIDSFTMYPNFVPDIDLSDKNISDVDSPPKSPGAESIIVSEDEPPIPLKIDKYFEHSPEFFGARITDPNSTEIPNRRATRRLSRQPKKPDSLTLQSNLNDRKFKEETERASSLPQSHSFQNKSCDLVEIIPKVQVLELTDQTKYDQSSNSPKEYLSTIGRKNSERALQIIQENSKILSRILTKQNISETPYFNQSLSPNVSEEKSDKLTSLQCYKIPEKTTLLKESTSDSLIGYRKRYSKNDHNDNDFMRIRPISIDDPFSLESRNVALSKTEDFKTTKSPSSECLGNKTDCYGWENKAFLGKCELNKIIEKSEINSINNPGQKGNELSSQSDYKKEINSSTTPVWMKRSFSRESKTSVTLPSTETRDTSYDRKFGSDEYSYPLSKKYNDFVISRASDICSETVNEGPKICEKISKTENSQVSDFAHVVTSSISFTYEPSLDDDSGGAKSNSSDTLCQITSLGQVSTPISPKIFPKDTSSMPREQCERVDKTKADSDDTCSAITSLIETDTLSSLSYPQSPSTGSYHPFPARPVMRMPKEIGVKLGMYPKDVISSPPKQ